MMSARNNKLVILILVLLLAGSLFAAREKRKAGEGEDKPKGPSKVKMEGPVIQTDSKSMLQRDKAIDQLLELIKDFPEGPKKAEVYRRLAELYWEKARSLKAVVMDEYNKATDKYYEMNNPDAPMPELDLKNAWKWNNKAIDICDHIIKKYDKFSGIDEVYFFMASNLMEVGQPLKAIRYYQLVVEKYKNSKFAADAYYEMGEYFFNNNNVFKAMPSYKAIIDNFPTDKFFGFALYKYAWCQYNVGEYAESIKVFQQVVEFSEKQQKVSLKEDALNDMVAPFAEAGSVDDAEKYFKTIVKEQKYFLAVLKKLAQIYFEQDRSEEAVKIYRKLLKEAPTRSEAPLWQKQIVESYKKLNMKDNVREEIVNLVKVYADANSAWSKANIKDTTTIESASQTAEANLRILLVEYHNEARKTKADKTWSIVEEMYPTYLKYFPKSEAAYDIRFNYAEFLYEKKKYKEAGDQYQIIADMNAKGHHFEDASYGAVSCFGALLEDEQKKQKEKARESLKERADVGIDENKVKIAGSDKKAEKKADKAEKKEAKEQKKEAKEAKETKEAKEEVKKEMPKPMEIPELHQKFIKACETYIKNIPRSKYLVDIIYKQAITYYAFNHFQESVPVFEMIVQKYPREELAQYAADLTMTSLDLTEDWEAISSKAREFLRNSALISGRNRLKDDLEKFKEMATFYAAENPAKKGNSIETAERYIAFVTEFPNSKFNDIALNNAIFYYQKGEDLYKSIRVQERFLSETAKMYKESKLRDDIVFGLAKNYGAIAYYDKAAGLFVDFATKAPNNKNAGDAVYNAAVLYENIGDTEKAIDNYKLYVNKYAKDDKDKSRIALQYGYIWMRKGKSFYDKAKKGFDKFFEEYTQIKGLKDYVFLDKNGKKASPTDSPVEISKGDMNIIYAVYSAFISMAKDEDNKPEYYKNIDKVLQLFRKGQFKEKEAFAETTSDIIAEAMIIELNAEVDDYLALNFDVKYKKMNYETDPATGMPIEYANENAIPKAIKAEMDKFNDETTKRLTKKAEMLVGLEKSYMAIIEQTKSPRLTPGALFNIGRLYRDMTDKMFAAPLPPWLNENQKIAYKNMLDEKALNARQRAVDLLEKALYKGYETSVYNEWVKKAKSELKYFQELRPGKYYDENEIIPDSDMIETSSLIGRIDTDIKFQAISNEEKEKLLDKLKNPEPETKPEVKPEVKPVTTDAAKEKPADAKENTKEKK